LGRAGGRRTGDLGAFGARASPWEIRRIARLNGLSPVVGAGAGGEGGVGRAGGGGAGRVGGTEAAGGGGVAGG
jgi:hypothetical protein